MDVAGLNELIKSKKLEDRLRAVRLASRLPEGERLAPLLRLLHDRASYVAALGGSRVGEWRGQLRRGLLRR